VRGQRRTFESEVARTTENASQGNRTNLEAHRGRNSAKGLQHWAVSRLAYLARQQCLCANVSLRFAALRNNPPVFNSTMPRGGARRFSRHRAFLFLKPADDQFIATVIVFGQARVEWRAGLDQGRSWQAHESPKDRQVHEGRDALQPFLERVVSGWSRTTNRPGRP
jgi:hypothetical protein